MLALTLSAFLVAQPGEANAPLKYARLTLKQAERLDGQPVEMTFAVATPAYTLGEEKRVRTIVGPADRGDGCEWSVAQAGNRLDDADESALKAQGVRQGIHPATVGGVLIGPGAEVRLPE